MAAPKVTRLVYRLGRRTLDHKRCQAAVSENTARWRNFAGKDTQCELGALYRVDGFYLCKRHAGDLLIQHLLSGEELVGPKPNRPARTNRK